MRASAVTKSWDSMRVAVPAGGGAESRRCYHSQPSEAKGSEHVATTERPATTLISMTENAAAKIKQLMAEEPDGDVTVLRVAIQGG